MDITTIPFVEEQANKTPFPPNCPVYIYDETEYPPGIDGQGIVSGVMMELDHRTGQSTTYFIVDVKCRVWGRKKTKKTTKKTMMNMKMNMIKSGSNCTQGTSNGHNDNNGNGNSDRNDDEYQNECYSKREVVKITQLRYKNGCRVNLRCSTSTRTRSCTRTRTKNIHINTCSSSSSSCSRASHNANANPDTDPDTNTNAITNANHQRECIVLGICDNLQKGEMGKNDNDYNNNNHHHTNGSTSTSTTNNSSSFWYCLQEVGGTQRIHHKVFPKDVSFCLYPTEYSYEDDIDDDHDHRCSNNHNHNDYNYNNNNHDNIQQSESELPEPKTAATTTKTKITTTEAGMPVEVTTHATTMAVSNQDKREASPHANENEHQNEYKNEHRNDHGNDHAQEHAQEHGNNAQNVIQNQNQNFSVPKCISLPDRKDDTEMSITTMATYTCTTSASVAASVANNNYYYTPQYDNSNNNSNNNSNSNTHVKQCSPMTRTPPSTGGIEEDDDDDDDEDGGGTAVPSCSNTTFENIIGDNNDNNDDHNNNNKKKKKKNSKYYDQNDTNDNIIIKQGHSMSISEDTTFSQDQAKAGGNFNSQQSFRTNTQANAATTATTATTTTTPTGTNASTSRFTTTATTATTSNTNFAKNESTAIVHINAYNNTNVQQTQQQQQQQQQELQPHLVESNTSFDRDNNSSNNSFSMLNEALKTSRGPSRCGNNSLEEGKREGENRTRAGAGGGAGGGAGLKTARFTPPIRTSANQNNHNSRNNVDKQLALSDYTRDTKAYHHRIQGGDRYGTRDNSLGSRLGRGSGSESTVMRRQGSRTSCDEPQKSTNLVIGPRGNRNLDNYLDKLLLSPPYDTLVSRHSGGAILSTFTMSKVIFDYISSHAESSVCSRDIGKHLNKLQIKGGMGSVLEDLKYSRRSLKRLVLDMNKIFALDHSDANDCSFLISLQPGASENLEVQAKNASFTKVEIEFLKDRQAMLKRGRKSKKNTKYSGDYDRSFVHGEVGLSEAVGLQRSKGAKRNLDSTEIATDEGSKDRRSRRRMGSSTSDHKCCLELPLRKSEAYDILIGHSGSIHKALLKESRCKKIALRQCGVDRSTIDIVARDRDTAEDGANMALEKLRECISDGRLNNVLISHVTDSRHQPRQMWCDYHQNSSHNTEDCKSRYSRT